MRFVSRRPFCKWPSRPIPRVKICKSAFHFCYTNIQIIFLLYKSDLYICIQENRPQTPINKGFFHVSQIGIYRYTDCLHIQRERGKGRGMGLSGRNWHKRKRPPHPYMGCRRPPGQAPGTCAKEKKYVITGLLDPRCPASAASGGLPRPSCAGGSSPPAPARRSPCRAMSGCCGPVC